MLVASCVKISDQGYAEQNKKSKEAHKAFVMFWRKSTFLQCYGLLWELSHDTSYSTRKRTAIEITIVGGTEGPHGSGDSRMKKVGGYCGAKEKSGGAA